MPGIVMLTLISQICCLPGCGFGFPLSDIEAVPREYEDETLISGKIDIGIGGGPVIKFGQMNGEFACLVGGHGGIIINHFFTIGGGGYGLTNEIAVRPAGAPVNYLLDFGYGGVFFEFVPWSKEILHFSVHSLIGGGGAAYRDYYYYDPYYTDAFFVAEPGADLELNISRHFRIGFGGTYLLIDGIGLSGISDRALDGPTAALTFKFHF